MQLKTWFQQCRAQCSTLERRGTDPIICRLQAVGSSGLALFSKCYTHEICHFFASANCLTHASMRLLGLTTADEFDLLICHSSFIITAAEFENKYNCSRLNFEGYSSCLRRQYGSGPLKRISLKVAPSIENLNFIEEQLQPTTAATQLPHLWSGTVVGLWKFSAVWQYQS